MNEAGCWLLVAGYWFLAKGIIVLFFLPAASSQKQVAL